MQKISGKILSVLDAWDGVTRIINHSGYFKNKTEVEKFLCDKLRTAKSGEYQEYRVYQEGVVKIHGAVLIK